MRTSLHAALLVVAAAGAARADHTDPGSWVTIRGSGTTQGFFYRIDTPFDQGPASPEGLVDLFPAGESFEIELVYDPAHITIDMSAPGQTYVLGPPQSMTLQVGNDTFTGNHSLPEAFDPYLSNLGVLNDFGPQSVDQISGGFIYTLMNGSSEPVAGYRLDSAGLYITDEDGTALSSHAIPTSFCAAAFELLGVGVWFDPDPADPASVRYMLVGTGTPDRSGDSDGDGIADGEELALRATLPALDACDADSDDDSLPDGAEIAAGTSPVAGDTDGDGLPDATDPDPLDPGSTIDEVAEDVRDAATGVLEIPEGEFDAPNANAQRGRRNALANRLQAAANEIEAGNLEEALAILRHVRDLIDGQSPPPDVMDDGSAKDELFAEVDALIALLEAQLAT